MGDGKPPNHQLAQARYRLVSPSGSGRTMSRQELAEAVNSYLWDTYREVANLNASSVGDLELGRNRWPSVRRREGFRHVLGVATDAELGFHIIRGLQGKASTVEDWPAKPATDAMGVEQLRRDLLGAVHDEPSDQAEWDAIAWEYGCLYASTPPQILLESLRTDLAVANTQLRHLRADAARRDLFRVLAQLGAFLAQTMSNLGSYQTGQRWWRFARQMADASTEPQVRVWVRGREVIRGLHEHRQVSGIIDLADEAAAISRTAGMGTGSVLIGRAQALAIQGRTAAANDAMNAVYTVMDRLPAHIANDTTSMYGWPEYRLRHGESFVFTYLGERDRAEVAQTRALALYPPHMFRERAQVRLHQAMWLVRGGDSQDGVNHARQAIVDLPAEQRIEVVLDMARSIARAVPAAERHRSGVAELQGVVGQRHAPQSRDGARRGG